MMKKQKTRKEKGITLIALVVTIIVLIILAGVTLNIILDQNGIISKTQQAKEEWNEAEIAEKEAMLKAEAKILEFQNNTEHEMIEYYIDEVPIPKGFVYKEGTKETGLVIINKEDENEFIWIPMSIEEVEEAEETYDSSVFLNNPDYPEMEKLTNSIKEYGGYYAARYQAGADVEITSLEQADQTVYSQAGKHPYIHVSIEKIIRLSKSMYPENETNTTGAISTYTGGYAQGIRNIEDRFGIEQIPGGISSLYKEFSNLVNVPPIPELNLDASIGTCVEYYDIEDNKMIVETVTTSTNAINLLKRDLTSDFREEVTFRPLLYIKSAAEGTE